KPPARAKKAAIITLIMELVGADLPAAGDPTGSDPTGGDVTGGDVSGGDLSGGGTAGDDASRDLAADDVPALGSDGSDQGEAATDVDRDRDDPGTPSRARESNPGVNGTARGEQDQGDRNRGDREPRGRNDGHANQASKASQATQANQDVREGASLRDGRGAASNQASPAGPGNEAPPSNEANDDEGGANRRRRRRGRDRDRRPDGEDQQAQQEPMAVEGMVDLRDEGYGFLRVQGFKPSPEDVYVSVKQTRQFGLRTGDVVGGKARPANRNERNPALLQVERVNGHPSHQQPPRVRFGDLTPLFPDERLRLEQDDPDNTTVRIIDLVAPIGKGQRGLIVSPPKAGKTTIVKHVVRSIEANHPEVELIVLLVDERPEEVTDMRRWLRRGEVAASTFDRPADEHVAVAELVIERAKRLVEQGKDVVVVLDGITRLARAYNLAAPATGRIMAGGIDTGALYPPKKFFGAARNAEEGGSLTILATALVETNTRMDEVIFEEFKGTGNMELKLDRKLAERRIFPAIDVDASSTRHEELLFDRNALQQVWKLRRVLGALRDESGSGSTGVEMLNDRLKAFKTNDDFLVEVARTGGT
ncbi:MAG: transcription termination factor Rho, partial [Acidimicrobiales bacterium]